jgi:hypothetical protein
MLRRVLVASAYPVVIVGPENIHELWNGHAGLWARFASDDVPSVRQRWDRAAPLVQELLSADLGQHAGASSQMATSP